MPTYEYRCQSCGQEFSRIMSLQEKETAKVTCPQCQSSDVVQQMATVVTFTSRKS